MTVRLASAVRDISNRRPTVAVIGDYLLDGWWSGHTQRIAREAPAPVVDVDTRTHTPGGAANTALNLASLGAKVLAVGLVGDDDAGSLLRERLAEAGVDVSRLRPVDAARTTTKVRVSVDDQLLVRLDDGQIDAWPQRELDALLDEALDATALADAQLFCDYGSAIFTAGTLEQLARHPRPRLRVVDAHDPTRWRALTPDIVTPNAAEAAAVVDATLGDGEARVAQVLANATTLFQRTGASGIIVTLDRSGTLLLRQGTEPHRTHAHPVSEKQASGAGDVFVAAVTIASAAGLPLEIAAELGQQAADIAVRKSGTCVCTLDELHSSVNEAGDATTALDDLATLLEGHRAAGERIVFTNGCFDVLHRGHTTHLRQARRLGDVLVVAVNSDDSVRRLKGADRPINSAADRATLLAELSCVDYVLVFDDDTADTLITRLRPDVYVKGGDYTPEMLTETAAITAVGGEIEILDYIETHSTTQLFGRIRASEQHPSPTKGRTA